MSTSSRWTSRWRCAAGIAFASLSVPLAVVPALAFDFGVDPLSPEVASGARSPADIYDSSGGTLLISAPALGLDPGDNIDAMSYGHDHIVPLGPLNFVRVHYSVTRNTVGARGGGFPGAGVVNFQARTDGAAGDKFFVTAVGTPRIGMITTLNGLKSNAPMHQLSPLPDPQSDLDSMSGPFFSSAEPIYFSVDPATAASHNWRPGHILRFEPPPPGGTPTITVWATDRMLGITGLDINALAIQNRGDTDDFDNGDVVWVSLAGQASVIQVSPVVRGRGNVVLAARNMGLLPNDDLNALTGLDPGPFDDGEQKEPRSKRRQADFDEILAATQVLSSTSVTRSFTGSLPEAVGFLEKLAERKVVRPHDVALPTAEVHIAGEGELLGDALQEILRTVDWELSIDLQGRPTISPRGADTE